MALLDFLKNKKDAEKSKKPVKASVAKKPEAEKKETPAVAPSSGTSQGKFSYEVIAAPHISEKSNNLGERNKYVFKIYERANKLQIKKAIEGIYGVNVVAVNTIEIARKKRRIGKTEGFKKSYRKAVVTIKEGQKIEFF